LKIDVIIIGAGASGLMSAIHAAKRGCRTLIIDHLSRAGKKILLSGGGKCNITNRNISSADYYGIDIAFCKYALKHFPTASTLRLLQEAQIAIEERDYGRIFCKKGAYEVVDYLVRTAEQLGVCFRMNTQISEVRHVNDVFVVDCCEQLFEAKHLLVASGGLAFPQIGATELGYTLAKKFGHTIVPLKPALAGFILPPTSPLRNLQGISLDVRIQFKGKSQIIEEPLLFTHQGISGPAALQASCLWEADDTLHLDFLPSNDVVSQMHYPENGKLQVKKLMTRFLPERLVKALIPEQLSDRKVAELSKKNRQIIARAIHAQPVMPDTVDSFAKAEVTLGGVSTQEINPKSMESLLLKGLYFSGEVIDITGRLGGYNIHWAFASGYVAGENM